MITDCGGTTTYTWNARNQLVGISGPGVSAAFVCDGLGRREKKTINSNLTEFLYDRVNPVQETSGSTVLANILPGLGIDEFLTRTDVVAGVTSAFLADALGSPVAVTDTNGGVQTDYTYEPFGRTTISGSSNSNPYQYTGRENDEAGLYYYRARFYQPVLQGFITQDLTLTKANPDLLVPVPLDTPQELNGYAYARNNPNVFVDPSGLISCKERWMQVASHRIALTACLCFWLCIPCDGPTIWGNNYWTLPSTSGVMGSVREVQT